MRTHTNSLRIILLAAFLLNLLLLLALIGGNGPAFSDDPTRTPVSNAVLMRVEAENAALVGRAGNWQQHWQATASGGAYLTSGGQDGDVLALVFEGTTVEVGYVAGPGQGRLAIEIDGAVVRTLMTEAEAPAFERTAVIDYLDDAPHTLRVYAAGGVIAVDVLRVSRLPEPVTPACDLEALRSAEAQFQAIVEARANPLTSGDYGEDETRAAALAYIRLAEACYDQLINPGGDGRVRIDDGELTEVPGDEGGPRFVFFGGKWGDSMVRPSTGGAVTYSFMPTGVDLGTDGGHSLSITLLDGFQTCFYNDIRMAFAAWAAVADIDFIEVTDNSAPASSSAAPDIRLGAHVFSNPAHLAHAYSPGTGFGGDIHFNIAYHWACDGGGFDIGIVALHEIGHGVGLGHEADVVAVMNPIYNPAVTTLQTDDVNGVRAVYGTRAYTHQGTLNWSQPRTVSITTTEQRWLVAIPAATEYYFQVERLAGNLDLEMTLKSRGVSPLASSTTTNGNAYFAVQSNSGYYFLYLKAQAGTSGTYRITLLAGIPPVSAAQNWDFAAQAGAQNWVATGSRLDHFTHDANGWTLAMPSARDPYLTSPPLNVPTSVGRYVAVKMKVSPTVGCTSARLYFSTTSASLVFSEARAVNTTIINNSEQIFYFDMQANAQWNGVLRRLRLDPVNCGLTGTGSVILKAISFTSSAKPPAATLLAPRGMIQNSSPVFSWAKVYNAEYYYIHIGTGTTGLFNAWYHTAQVCSTSVCTIQPAVEYENNVPYIWYVLTYGYNSYGDWSSGLTFTVSVPAPEAVNLVSPANNATLVEEHADFLWEAQSAVSWYHVYISSGTSVIYDRWHRFRELCFAQQCNLPDVPLPNGTYRWYVRGYNAAGYGPWGVGRQLTVAVPIPGVIGLQFPFTNFTFTTEAIPFRWTHDPMATWYELWIGTGAQAFHDRWYAATEICEAVDCRVPALTIANGSYHWYVRGYGPAGFGPWGTGRSFGVAVPLPAEIILLNPVQNAQITFEEVTFSWRRENYASWYEVWVIAGGQTVLRQWYSRFEVCIANTCAVGPVTVRNGALRWYVRGYTVTGSGSFGNGHSAQVAVGVPGLIVRTSPAAGAAIPGDRVVLEWQRDPYASWYEVYIGNPTSTILDRWYRTLDYCDEVICRLASAEVLPQGNYQWALRGYSLAGTGPWNAGQAITILPPGVVE